MIPKKAILVTCVIVCAAAVYIFVLTFFLADRIPAPDMTRTRIGLFEYRLHDYFAINHRLPASLSDVPKEANKDNEIDDAWGGQFST